MPSLASLSNARAYFEHIKSLPDPFNFLSEIPTRFETNPFFEEEWIDFKGQPQNEEDEKKIWSKVLSGFANITDGLIVWGIDARKTPPRGIDAACKLRLISDPQAFESRLRDWIRDATNPPVIGVEYQSYSNSSGDGFVVCLIPESIHKPHRAEFEHKNYYYRAGDDFLIAEPGLLRTLFYPQSNPYIWLEVDLHYRLKPVDLAIEYQKAPNDFGFNKLLNSGTSAMSLEVTLHNDGTATAKDLYIVVESSDRLNFYQRVDWDISENLLGSAAFLSRRPFHPGEVTELISAEFQQEFSNKSSDQSNDSWEIIPNFNKVSLQFFIFAEGTQRKEVAVEFTPEDLNFESGSATKKAVPT